MKPINPQNVAAKWAKNLGAAGDSIKAGVNAVTQSPGQVAANRKDAYVQGVNNKADKWATNVGRVTLQQWQQSMLEKGLNRIASGATAAKDKVSQFWVNFGPFLQSVQQNLPARGSLEDNIARMTQNVRRIADWNKNAS